MPKEHEAVILENHRERHRSLHKCLGGSCPI